LHIVFKIGIGGGLDSYVRNLSILAKQYAIDISVVLNEPPKDKFYNFPSNINVWQLEKGSDIPYYAYKIFELLGLPIHFGSKLIRREDEYLFLKTLRKIEEKKSIDIVEVTEGVFINKIIKYWKIIVRAHGSRWSFNNFCGDSKELLDEYLKIWQRKQHLNAFANFAISRHTRDHLTSELQLPEDKIKYIPYPIDIKKFQQAAPKKINGICRNGPIILSVGRLEHRKGMDVLVQSMNIVWEKIPNALLVLLGEPVDFSINDLKKIVPQNCRDLIIHPGFVNYDEIPSYYKAVDLYVSASQYETFGYTILEAFSAGKPVISTDRGALPELIKNGYNGFTVPFGDSKRLGDAIIKILKNDSLKNLFGENSFQIAKKYDVSTFGHKLINSYIELIHQAHPSSHQKV